MGKLVSVVVDLKSKHYTDEYLEELKTHLIEAGLELDDKIDLKKNKLFMDYNADYMIDGWSDFINDIEEKFPTVSETDFEADNQVEKSWLKA